MRRAGLQQRQGPTPAGAARRACGGGCRGRGVRGAEGPVAEREGRGGQSGVTAGAWRGVTTRSVAPGGVCVRWWGRGPGRCEGGWAGAVGGGPPPPPAPATAECVTRLQRPPDIRAVHLMLTTMPRVSLVP